MNDPVFGYEIVEHTGDLAIKVEAEFLPDIFRFCATGMFDVMVGLGDIQLDLGERIEIKGPDLENLLVRMLSELLYRFSTQGMVYGDFIIEYLTHEKLIIYAQGQKINLEIHNVKREIKAATYHDLRIEATDHGFALTIVFDV